MFSIRGGTNGSGRMMRTLLIAATTLLCLTGPALLAQREGDTRRAPKFRVDPAWPKIPNGWQFGQVSSVSIDADDHVWVLQRPGTLAPEEKSKAAPPVLEFTSDGTLYATFSDWTSGGATETDVWLTKSTNNGATGKLSTEMNSLIRRTEACRCGSSL